MTRDTAQALGVRIVREIMRSRPYDEASASDAILEVVVAFTRDLELAARVRFLGALSERLETITLDELSASLGAIH